MTFVEAQETDLPKEMNNLQFSKVLELCEARVIGKATGKRKEVLQEQSKLIHRYKGRCQVVERIT
jgi:hypothetical protein